MSTAALTIERILAEPLPHLLAEVHGEVLELPALDDPEFFGSIVANPRKAGVVFAMPAGRSADERDCVVRLLVAQLLHLDTTGFPSSIAVSDFKVAA
ncbi:hypothetical protein [Streptomyces noursei]|uniref:hypothetical protein n=1 Tax=Streptomyces noursei TaxID=1971 RepID=UPI0035DBA51E